MVKKILITGGLGLIGSNLAIKLTNLDYKVTIVDDFSTGKTKNIPNSIKKK